MSGISVYTCRLSNALANKYPVSVILMRRLLPRRFYPGAGRVGAELASLTYHDAVSVFDGVDYYWVPSIARAARFLRRERPDVLLFEWWSGTVLHTYLLLALIGRLLGCRTVIEFHELLDTGEAARFLPRLYVNLFLRPLLRLADTYVVHSEYDKRVIADRFSCADDQVLVVPHGPYDHFCPVPSRSEPEDGVCTFLFFGTIRPYKGLEHLIAAFSSLSSEQAARFRLLIVGETWEGWTLPTKLIAASPNRDRITFVNRYVHDHEISDYFAAADAVVLPYTRSSSSGPLHIAMSQGKPVAITPVGGLAEAAGRYAGTRFIRPNDPDDVRAALFDLAHVAGRRFGDPYSWDQSVSLLQSVLTTN
jgi:glycosyltransferase involved in cell wall biosynthesis